MCNNKITQPHPKKLCVHLLVNSNKIANKIIHDLGKVTMSAQMLSRHLTPTYLGGSKKLGASLEVFLWFTCDFEEF